MIKDQFAREAQYHRLSQGQIFVSVFGVSVKEKSWMPRLREPREGGFTAPLPRPDLLWVLP